MFFASLETSFTECFEEVSFLRTIPTLASIIDNENTGLYNVLCNTL